MGKFINWFPVPVFLVCTLSLITTGHYEAAWYCGCATWFAFESRIGLLDGLNK